MFMSLCPFNVVGHLHKTMLKLDDIHNTFRSNTIECVVLTIYDVTERSIGYVRSIQVYNFFFFLRS